MQNDETFSAINAESVDESVAKHSTKNERETCEEVHLLPNILTQLEQRNWLRMYNNPRLEEEYVVFNVAGKWVLSVFSTVIAVGYLLVGGIAGYFSHPWLGYAHVTVGTLAIVIAVGNYWFCIRGVRNSSSGDQALAPQLVSLDASGSSMRPSSRHFSPASSAAVILQPSGPPVGEFATSKAREVALKAAKLHEKFGFALMMLCLTLPFFQTQYSVQCLERKVNYPTKHRDCVRNIFGHGILLVMAYGVLLRHRPIVSTLPIALVPVALGIGWAIEPVSDAANFGFNIAINVVICFLTIAFAFILDVQDRDKFRDMIALKYHRHRATVARQSLDTTLASILPKSVLARLSNGEPVMDVSANAAISVCEIFDFVQWSTSLLPSSIFQAVNALYSAFDETTVRYKIEKLKAVGDQYISSVGVQEPVFPGDVAKLITFGLKQLHLVRKLAQIIDTTTPPALRIGIHSGPAVGGIIGSQSLSYEVFGRTLELARAVTLTGGRDALVVSAKVLEFGVKDRFALRKHIAISSVCPGECSTASPVAATSPDLQLHVVLGQAASPAAAGVFEHAIVKEGGNDEMASAVPNEGATVDSGGTVFDDFVPYPPLGESVGGPGVAVVDPDFNLESDQGDILATHPLQQRGASPGIVATAGEDFQSITAPSDSQRGSSLRRASTSSVRHVHVRYRILLDHIKQRRRHSDNMMHLSSFDDLMGRELVEEVAANFARRTKSCFFSVKFQMLDIQAAYRDYLRRVDRDDGMQVMIVLSTFLIALLVIVITETSAGLVSQGIGGIVLLAAAMIMAVLRTIYRRLVITPSWEVVALLATTILTYVAVAVLEPSIVNGEYQYLNAVFVPLIAYNCIRQPVVMLTLAMVLGSVAPLVIVSVVTQGRVPLELPVITPLWLLSGLYMARDRETYHLAHFVNASLSELHLRCAEDELHLQRELLNMIFPRHAVNAIIDQCTVMHRNDTVFVQKFNDVCVLLLRIDGLAPMFRNINENANLSLLKRIEDVVARIEEAIEAAPLLSRIHTIGDSYLIVGPILAEDEAPPVASLEGGNGSPTEAHPTLPMSPSAPLVPTAADDGQLPALDEVGGAAQPHPLLPNFEAEMRRKLAHEENLTAAALGCIDVLATLKQNLPVAFTAIVNVGSAYGAVMGSERITFDVIGVATRQASALMTAAPTGFCGATASYKRVLDGVRVVLPRHERDARFIAPSSWRVRGVGSMPIFPITWGRKLGLNGAIDCDDQADCDDPSQLDSQLRAPSGGSAVKYDGSFSRSGSRGISSISLPVAEKM